MRLPTPAELAAAGRRGDPPADAVAERVGAEPSVRAELAAALAGAPARTPAVRALVEEMERTALAVPDVVHEVSSRIAYTAPFAAHVFDIGAGSLLRSYAPPAPAAVLVSTGRLVEGASERLLSTGRWLNAASVPGWLRPGQPGFVETGRVRLVHALVRRHAPRVEGHLPVSQLDQVRTWLDFSLVAPVCAEAVGLPLTQEEQRELFRYWHHLGALLGIERPLVAAAVDRASARELDRRVAALTGPPSRDSRTLTAAGLQALADGLVDVSGLPPRLALPAVRAVARAMHDRSTADALGIGRTPVLDALVPAVAVLVRARRARLRRRPAAWHAMVEANVETARRFVRDGALPAPPLAGVRRALRLAAA